jgi:hypothetical protein
MVASRINRASSASCQLLGWCESVGFDIDQHILGLAQRMASLTVCFLCISLILH